MYDFDAEAPALGLEDDLSLPALPRLPPVTLFLTLVEPGLVSERLGLGR